MIYQCIGVCLCLLVLLLSVMRRLSFFSPPVLTSAVWGVVFSVGLGISERFYSITNEAFTAWVIWFSITGLGAFFFTPSGTQHIATRSIRTLRVDYSYILVFLIIWLIYRIWVVGSSGPEHFFLNLRLSSNGIEGFTSLGLIGRFYPIIFSLFIFEHIYEHKNNRSLRVLCWIWMLGYAVATMGKFAVLTPVLAWSVIQGIQRKLHYTLIIRLGIIVVGLMIAVHYIRAGVEDQSGLIDVVSVYVYSPIVALGYMQTGLEDVIGPYVFRILYAIGSVLGLAEPPVENIFEYVTIPVPTNVYTVIQPFVHDFGYLGVINGAFTYMIMFVVIFIYARYKGGYALGLYSGLSIILVGQFFGELFYSMMSGHIQFALALAVFFAISQKVSNEKCC